MPYFSLVCRQVLRYIAVECCQFIYDMNHPPENKNTNSESLTILIRLIHSLNIKTQLYITALVVIVHNIRGHCGIPLAPSHSLTTLFSSPPLLFLFSPPTHSVLFSSLESFSSSLVLFLFLFFSIFLISFFFLSYILLFPVTYCDSPPCCFSIGRDPSSPRWRVARPRPRPTPGPRATPAILYVSTMLIFYYLSIILTMAGAKTLQVSSFSTPLLFFFFFAAFVRHCRFPAFSAQHLRRDHGSHQ